MKSINGFRGLELSLNEDTKYAHTIYFKEHIVREHTNDKPQGRTLFVINIPPYVDEKGLKNAFSEVGHIESIQFATKPNEKVVSNHKFMNKTHCQSFKLAYIVFDKVANLHKALKLKRLGLIENNNQTTITGLRKWIDEHNNNILHHKELKKLIEDFMKDHDEKSKLELEKEKQLEEDGEGWTKVTRKGKVQSFARSDKAENKILAKEELSKKRKELKNFYTFQIRESKMKNIVALRQKFEEDKRKIAQIKSSRRFKPF